MLDNLNGSNEKTLLERISKARGNSEPEAPTEEPISLEVSPEEIDVEEVEAEAETVEALVESVEEDETLETDNDLEDSYIDFNGEEISFTQIEEWKQGNLRQSDYTRKSQVNAEERKANEATKTALNVKGQKLDDSIAQLEVLVEEFNTVEVDGMSLKELREIDPEQYLTITEKQAKRKEALKNAKSLKTESSDNQRSENAKSELDKLVANNPHWVKDGKETKAYGKELKQTEDYLLSLGMNEQEQKGILLGGYGQVFIDAAKHHASKKTNAAIVKRVRKAPVTTRPSGAGKSSNTITLEKARKNHKEHGTADTAVALRKAQRNLKGE